MIFKILCLCAGSVGYVASNFQPRTSTTKSKQVDKAKDEGLLIRIVIHVLSIMATVHALGTVVYILLMIYTNGHSGKNPSLSITGNKDVDVALWQLIELETWQVVMTIVSVLSSLFRLWSFVTLDRFFTYALFIHKDHKLVSTGPYKYLRHPSYLGLVTTISVSYLLMLHQGLWPVFTSWFAASFQNYIVPCAPSAFPLLLSILRRIPFWAQIAGPNGGAWVTLPIAVIWSYLINGRMTREEVMMREHFGQEWDLYASKRWKVIPLVY
ncbi:hypothetical protein EMPS_02657 [Entomortierella parvispora]|uniref:Protein-S-isoprenylcysteine O-methyltransferase n=1 Tax=Entomortierella parvispora TaxID=205924 RepID=A0A9P3H5A3_9FUNG|nr:hypothetical protein EMPS_02657 [Entomortierella parvispora]